MSADKSSKRTRLAAAAEALIEAASLESDAKRLTESLTENFDAKMNTFNQNVASLNQNIVALKTLLEKDVKQKTLDRAQSSETAKTTIKWFLLGYGYVLPDGQ